MATDTEIEAQEMEVIEEQIIEEEVIEEHVIEEEIIEESLQNDEDLKLNFIENLMTAIKNEEKKFEETNTWLLCEFLVPIVERSSETRPKNDQFEVKFKSPLMTMSTNDAQSHIHICQAINQHGQASIPLVVFPQNSEIESNMTELMRQTSVIGESEFGALNAELMTRWLEKFLQQINTKNSLIIIKNSNIPLVSQDVIILSYPNGELNPYRSLFIKFKENFKQISTEFAMKDSLNGQMSILFVIKQTLRRIIEQETTKLCFQDFLRTFQLPLEMSDFQADLNHQVSTNNDDNESQSSDQIPSYSSLNIYFDLDPNATTNENDNLDETNTSNMQLSTSQLQATPISYQIKFTEQEINEYTQWINQMCSIGCLCVKYTFLRDLNSRLKNQIKTSKEIIAAEKRWSDLIRKNKQKFMNNMFCTNEDLYFMNWFDLDQWRVKYTNLIKDKKLTNPASIWTFDILNFPYSLNTSHLKAPERDVSRPRNIKPRVSVIFAFNASGDYIQPYFVYPTNFGDDGCGSGGDTSDLATNECYAQNGYVTSKIFNQWLNTQFIPYLSQTKTATLKSHLLLYCGKLAVIDFTNMRLITDHGISLFCMTHESIMPFNYVFHKNIRKRQCDLLLDSWKKVTSKQGVAYTFKCKSKAQFSNLFMDAFQMCIEELGDFKAKIQSSFTVCRLVMPREVEPNIARIKIEAQESIESYGGYADEGEYDEEEEYNEEMNQEEEYEEEENEEAGDDSDEEFVPDKKPRNYQAIVQTQSKKRRESATHIAPPAKRPKGRPRKQPQAAQSQIPIYHKIEYDYMDTLNGSVRTLDDNDTNTNNTDDSTQNQDQSQLNDTLDFPMIEEESKSLAEIINTNEEFRSEVKLLIRAEIQKYLNERHMDLVMHLKVFIHKIIDDFRVKLAEVGEFGILENLSQICDDLIELNIPHMSNVQFNSMIFDLIKRFFFNFHQYQQLSNLELTEKFIQIYETKLGLQRDSQYTENAKIVNYTELLNESKLSQKCSFIANAILASATNL